MKEASRRFKAIHDSPAHERKQESSHLAIQSHFIVLYLVWVCPNQPTCLKVIIEELNRGEKCRCFEYFTFHFINKQKPEVCFEEKTINVFQSASQLIVYFLHLFKPPIDTANNWKKFSHIYTHYFLNYLKKSFSRHSSQVIRSTGKKKHLFMISHWCETTTIGSKST